MKKHQTTLKLEGDHDFTNNRKFYSLPSVSRAKAIRPQDNLFLQGDQNFDSLESSPTRSKVPLFIGDRVPVKRYQDNLKPDGVFYGFTPGKDYRGIKAPVSELGLSPRHIQRSVMDRRSFRSSRSSINSMLFDDQRFNLSSDELYDAENPSRDSLQPRTSHSRASESNYPDVAKMGSKSSSIETFSDSISNANVDAVDEGAVLCILRKCEPQHRLFATSFAPSFFSVHLSATTTSTCHH